MQISAYRDDNNHSNKQRLDQTVLAVRATALECYEDGVEAGLACCSTALDVWNGYSENHTDICDDGNDVADIETATPPEPSIPNSTAATVRRYQWLTSDESNMILDRKSIFVGHVCTIRYESDVQPALHQLISNNNKLQRATHHMVCMYVFVCEILFRFYSKILIVLLQDFVQYAYRLTEEKVVIEKHHKSDVPTTKTLSILKYDSNDDGEDGAGIRLSQLLQLRNEMNVLVVVTRWFGGIHLGSKRFAHIVAAAQSVLVEHHSQTSS